ncbi:unnamed protein product [Lactuca virosa]|uniref:Uncharacterized protein n=1 Tax=Lactuca virosa TaxID=75947 RepID=A0AAU9PTI7_9ASTR|nr:unnamed protein product [Lactuca virosa]
MASKSIVSVVLVIAFNLLLCVVVSGCETSDIPEPTLNPNQKPNPNPSSNPNPNPYSNPSLTLTKTPTPTPTRTTPPTPTRTGYQTQPQIQKPALETP